MRGKPKYPKHCPMCQNRIKKEYYLSWFTFKDGKEILTDRIAYCSQTCVDTAKIIGRLVKGVENDE